MERPERPLRCRKARKKGSWLMAAALLFLMDSAAVGGQFLASYPEVSGGSTCESVAVPMEGKFLVTVFAPGANVNAPSLRSGNKNIPVRMIGHDPVTRLVILESSAGAVTGQGEWLADAGGSVGVPLRADGPDGLVKCLVTGWVKQIGGKVLPLALLRVNFDQAVPPAGTALVDLRGKVVGIVFQGTGNDNTGYAIPAEAVHRVRRDLCNDGHLIRGWLGLSLFSGSSAPRIVRVLPESPAAAVGIRPGDVLLAVGSRQISDYADAANAFFYLIPGQETQVKVLRDGKPLAFSLTPVQVRAE